MDVFIKIYLILLGLGLAPILLGWLLRSIAGKHAPKYYEHDNKPYEDFCKSLDEHYTYVQHWH